MAEKSEITGVVRGRRLIELDEEIPLPDGSQVRLVLFSDSRAASEAEEQAEAERTLQVIYQMRHQCRSVQRP